VISGADDFVTIDAMGCQTDIIEKIMEKKADVCVAVKKNQPKLMRPSKTACTDATFREDDCRVRKGHSDANLSKSSCLPSRLEQFVGSAGSSPTGSLIDLHHACGRFCRCPTRVSYAGFADCSGFSKLLSQERATSDPIHKAGLSFPRPRDRGFQCLLVPKICVWFCSP